MAHDQYYDSHSATELAAYLLPPHGIGLGEEPISFGTLAMVSVSTHRDKFPVTACSRIAPRGVTAGHRTVAGSLAFNTIDRAAFTTITTRAERSWLADGLLADELPPFNISVVFINDFGEASFSLIEGVTLLDCGITYSLENVSLMENYSYMAQNYVPLQTMKEPKRLATHDSASGLYEYDVTDVTAGKTSSSGTFVILPPTF